ncbi:MAG: ABC transporter permease [Treponema sp.]|jgi:sulfonate transport system permease protein|nr:ABC transporter permease [Treponema sp.]
MEQALQQQKKNPVKVNDILDKTKIIANLAAAPVLLIVLWQSLSSAGVFIEVVLPSPVNVVKGILKISRDGTLLIDLKASGYRVLVGYFWGALIGITLGFASGLSKLVERFVSPLVDVMRQIPMMAWIPLIILWFGIGELSKYIIIGKSVFVPIFVNTLQGIRGVSNDYIEVAAVLEVPYFKRLFKVILPSAMPLIFTGLRLGAGFAWMAVVAAEMLAGLSGLGYGLLHARDFLESDKLIGLMVVIGVLGFIIDRGILFTANHLLRWRKGFSGEKK